ncbi:MAG: CBS domain-containing protein [Halobacteriota archaeon]
MKLKWSFRIFNIAGIEIHLHLTLLIILAILTYILYQINPFPVGFSNLNYPEVIKFSLSVAASVSLFVAVLLHELAHSLLSKRSGIGVRGIMLFIFGGVSMMEETPEDPNKEIAIAFAGPFTSFAIAAFSYGFFLTNISILSEFFAVFGVFNFVLGAFNLLPAFPLDGGRILRGFLAKKMNFIKATQTASSIGKTFAVLMGIFGLFANPWLILIALFIYMGANEEQKMVEEKSLLPHLRVKDIMTAHPVTVIPETVVREVIDLMFKHRHLGYPVVKDEKLVGMITLQDVSQAPQDSTVGDLMSRDIATVSPEDPTYSIFQILNDRDIGRLPVVDDNGRLVGIVSRTDIVRLRAIVQETGQR